MISKIHNILEKIKHRIEYYVNLFRRKKTESVVPLLTLVNPIDPIIHNTQKSMDVFYSNPANVKLLSNEDQCKFYEEVIGLLKKINYDYSNLDVVDFGCGIGGLFEAFNKLYPVNNLYGYDFSIEAISLAKTKVPHASFAVFDFIEEKINKKFDIIFCTEVLEHILNPRIFIKNILENIKKSGIIIFTVPDGRKDNYLGHINFWSIESWKMFLSENFPASTIEVGFIENERILFCIIKV